jgi:hypothetical protein
MTLILTSDSPTQKPGTMAGFGYEKGPISKEWAMMGKS